MTSAPTDAAAHEDPGTRVGRTQFLRMSGAAVVSVGILLALHAIVAPNPRERNFEFAPEMARSPALETQSVATALPGGISELPIVPGVVVRGAHPFRYAATPEDAERAGRELTSPYPSNAADADADALARGARVYAVHCTVCHGADGAGRGAAVERGLPPPPSLTAATALATPDGALFHLVTVGRGNMPALGARIEHDDRWRALLHVRHLQQRTSR